MEWLSDIVGGVASVAGGGIFGSLMALGTSFMKAREAGKEHDRKLSIMKFNLEVAKSGHADTMEELRQVASTSGLIASIEADKIGGVSTWAANIKTLFRPFLTTVLICIAVYIFYMLYNAMFGDSNLMTDLFAPEAIKELLVYTVMSLIFSATTSVAWWYGERALTPPRSK